MMFNMSSSIFFISLITGTLISNSSTSWIGMWMGLEMNLLSFIPLMNKKYTMSKRICYEMLSCSGNCIYYIFIIYFTC